MTDRTDQNDKDSVITGLWNRVQEISDECMRLRNERDESRRALAELYDKKKMDEFKWKTEVTKLGEKYENAIDVYTTILYRLLNYGDTYNESFYILHDDGSYQPLGNCHMEMQIHHMHDQAILDVFTYPQYKLYKINRTDVMRQNCVTSKRRHIYEKYKYYPEFNFYFGRYAGINTLSVLSELPDVDITEPVKTIKSDILCELAENFSRYGKRYKYDSDKSRLFVKPAALNLWLQLGRSRPELTKIRIVTHGTHSRTVDAISKDAFGFSLCNAGFNGEARGRGVYCSLSDTISSLYSDENPGTMLMILLLTTSDMYEKYGSWTTYAFGTNFDNVVVIHESCLMLVLGKLVPKS